MEPDFYSPRSGRRVAETQHASFHSLTTKQLCHTQRMVMDCFIGQETLLTREEIAACTNLKLSSVCGRVRSLLDASLLQKRDTRRDAATGKSQELIGLPKA
ncbi:hypothetical protein QCE63_32225 [Caballeronia sp. LZ065]|uniref:hypothetical protein n=1 Tax=Caballeronia sp. LZ065 TaxID=3038571 RepID=UPI00286595AD|nr:hypothetical protein [Caballeronia sp. LZ065]MDR5784089.1 hypothetical protein [Caballeronia sp. LZ065]